MKEPTTFYYVSDGTGRDSYVLQNNGGYRPEYNIKMSGDRLFRTTLRSDTKSPTRTIQNTLNERANFDNYQNWHSLSSKQVSIKHAKI